MLEYPEVFYAERPDPLDDDQINRAARAVLRSDRGVTSLLLPAKAVGG